MRLPRHVFNMSRNDKKKQTKTRYAILNTQHGFCHCEGAGRPKQSHPVLPMDFLTINQKADFTNILILETKDQRHFLNE
jgi:hypothetical protein